MSWATLNSVVLDAPNGLEEQNKTLGADTTTLLGTIRRSIRVIKRVWTINYSHMTDAKYDEIYALYAAGNAVSFTITSGTYLDVSGVSVFLDLESRDFVPGNPSYVADVSLKLTER